MSNRIQAIPTSDIVGYLDKQYTNASKRRSLITVNCTLAIKEDIQWEFNEAAGQLGRDSS